MLRPFLCGSHRSIRRWFVRPVLILCFFFSSLVSFGSSLVDSLETELSTLPDDTTKVDVLITLARKTAATLDRATAYGEQALSLSDQLRDPIRKAKAHRAIGITNAMNGKVEAAVAHVMLAIDEFETAGRKKEVASLYGTIGAAYFQVGNNLEALRFHQKSLELATAIGDEPVMAQAFTNLSNVYRVRKKYNQSRQFIRQAMALHRENNPPKVLLDYVNLGAAYLDEGKLDSALLVLDEGLDLAKEFDDPRRHSELQMNRALIFAHREEYDPAIAGFVEAEKVVKELNDELTCLKCYHNLAALYEKKGDYDQTIVYAQKALDFSKRMNHVPIMITNYHVLMKAYGGKEEYEQALDISARIVHLRDSLEGSKQGELVAEMMAKFELEKKEAEIRQLQEEKAALAAQVQANEDRTLWSLIGMIAFGAGLLTFLLVFTLRRRTRGNASLTAPVSTPDSEGDLDLSNLPPLTAREKEILRLLTQGKTNKNIASELYISENTAKTHVSNIFSKLEVVNRTQAAEKARNFRLV